MGYPAIIPFRCADSDSYDPDALRIGRDEMDPGRRTRRKASRDRLFIPSTAWPELAAVVAAGVSGRSVGLWLAIRMQAKLEGHEWVRVRTNLRESLGFTNRAAHSRAVTELERLGLIEVQRRKGYAPPGRLGAQQAEKGEGNGDG